MIEKYIIDKLITYKIQIKIYIHDYYKLINIGNQKKKEKKKLYAFKIVCMLGRRMF